MARALRVCRCERLGGAHPCSVRRGAESHGRRSNVTEQETRMSKLLSALLAAGMGVGLSVAAAQNVDSDKDKAKAQEQKMQQKEQGTTGQKDQAGQEKFESGKPQQSETAGAPGRNDAQKKTYEEGKPGQSEATQQNQTQQ